MHFLFRFFWNKNFMTVSMYFQTEPDLLCPKSIPARRKSCPSDKAAMTRTKKFHSSSIQTFNGCPTGLVKYHTLLSTDTCNYVTRPLVSKGEAPWVYRFKIKRHINKLNKIIGSEAKVVPEDDTLIIE